MFEILDLSNPNTRFKKNALCSSFMQFLTFDAIKEYVEEERLFLDWNDNSWAIEFIKLLLNNVISFCRELRQLLANLKQEAVQLAKHPKPINILKH